MLTPFTSSEVWKPQISLLNTFSKFIIINDRKEEFVIWYTNDGTANLLIAGVFDVTCDPNVKYFPFDFHECVLLFIPFENFLFPEYASPFTIVIMEDPIIKDNFEERDDDGKWTYRTKKPCIVKIPNRELYAVAFPVTIHRRSTFALVNIILPVMMLGFLNLTVFFQPVQAGERVSFSITVLLSFTVFMVYIGEIIPETSNPMPLLSYVLVFKLGCSTCIVIAVTIVTRLFHREKRKVSPCVQKIVSKFLNMGSSFSCQKRDGDLSNITDRQNASCDDDRESCDVTQSLEEPKDDWGRMCLALDKLFFLFFLILLLMESVSYVIAYLVLSGMRIDKDMTSQTCTSGIE
ncbi:acetylcholine receptor subunit beta-like [Saccostrea cucullata]|uniref:acetylcholine receptor subunit beta-like n=1 Tax=Saccostrea cuccullata TaxID=36930 RepID=UPI002ED4BF57